MGKIGQWSADDHDYSSRYRLEYVAAFLDMKTFRSVGWPVSSCFNFGRCFYHIFNPYPTAFPYGNGMVLHFYQQQESSTTKTVHKVINKGLKTYV